MVTRRAPVQGERISASDLTLLTTDRGPAPMNLAALIRVEDGSLTPPAVVRATLSARVERVPRLHQLLAQRRRGLARPVWSDDPTFALDHHLDFRSGIATDEALLRLTADLACRRMSRQRPLWHATWVAGLPDGQAALILVIHHVVTDGYGGVALLRLLADAPPSLIGASDRREAARGGTAQLSEPPGRNPRSGTGRPGAFSRMIRGLAELGLTQGRPRLAERTAYNRPTGPRRRLTTVTRPMSDVIATAHGRGCTVNDIVLACAVGAMASTLASRGERPRRVGVSVPVSARSPEAGGALGNATGVVALAVPADPDTEARLHWISSTMRAHRAARQAPDSALASGDAGDGVRRATRERGESAGPLGLAFRGMARVGLFQAFIDHQRLVNTFVTNVRGPEVPIGVAGHRVRSIIPVAVTPGNVGVTFDVPSYAGELVISVVADPDVVTDPDSLTGRLEAELDHLIPRSAT